MSDCCNTTERMLDWREAQAFLLARATAPTATETLPLEQAQGRVLAVPVESGIDVPAWDNSAMDGYALNTADLGETLCLPVAQRIPAGDAGERLAPGTAARIFTGAPVPPGADAVIQQERCTRAGDRVTLGERPRPGDNIRRIGEDIRRGETILTPGMRLGPGHLGLAASVGCAELSVYRRLRVAIFSSGDELVMPGAGSLGPGQIYNSNHFTLTALVRALGMEPVPLGQVEDTLEATCAALERGAAEADVILSSGGVSVGEEDHVKPAVERLGSLDLWRIAIKPGKPLAFGQVCGKPFIGAPGNPVSLFVTFCLFARPFLLKAQGITEGLLPVMIPAVADFDWPKPTSRLEFVRARLEADEAGPARVRLYRTRSSAVLSSVVWANGLALIPKGRLLAKGDAVQFIPFSELMS